MHANVPVPHPMSSTDRTASSSTNATYDVEIVAVRIERVVDPSEPRIVEDGIGNSGRVCARHHRPPTRFPAPTGWRRRSPDIRRGLLGSATGWRHRHNRHAVRSVRIDATLLFGSRFCASRPSESRLEGVALTAEFGVARDGSASDRVLGPSGRPRVVQARYLRIEWETSDQTPPADGLDRAALGILVTRCVRRCSAGPCGCSSGLDTQAVSAKAHSGCAGTAGDAQPIRAEASTQCQVLRFHGPAPGLLGYDVLRDPAFEDSQRVVDRMAIQPQPAGACGRGDVWRDDDPVAVQQRVVGG